MQVKGESDRRANKALIDDVRQEIKKDMFNKCSATPQPFF